MKYRIFLMPLLLFSQVCFGQFEQLLVDYSGPFYAIRGSSTSSTGTGIWGQSTGSSGFGVVASGATALSCAATNPNGFAGEFFGGQGVIVRDSQALVTLNTDISGFGSVLTLRNFANAASYLGAINFEPAVGTPGQIAYRMDGNSRMTFRVAGVEPFMTLKTSGDHIVMSNGAILTSGGVWTDNCSAALKDIHGQLEGDEILRKISSLPIYQWTYKSNQQESHIGPMAEDFYQVFSLGVSNKNLAALDLGGVSLAGIQALIVENKRLQDQLKAHEIKFQAIEKELEFLKQHMEKTKRSDP